MLQRDKIRSKKYFDNYEELCSTVKTGSSASVKIPIIWDLLAGDSKIRNSDIKRIFDDRGLSMDLTLTGVIRRTFLHCKDLPQDPRSKNYRPTRKPKKGRGAREASAIRKVSDKQFARIWVDSENAEEVRKRLGYTSTSPAYMRAKSLRLKTHSDMAVISKSSSNGFDHYETWHSQVYSVLAALRGGTAVEAKLAGGDTGPDASSVMAIRDELTEISEKVVAPDFSVALQDLINEINVHMVNEDWDEIVIRRDGSAEWWKRQRWVSGAIPTPE